MKSLNTASPLRECVQGGPVCDVCLGITVLNPSSSCYPSSDFNLNGRGKKLDYVTNSSFFILHFHKRRRAWGGDVSCVSLKVRKQLKN